MRLDTVLVSMLDGELFDKLAKIASIIRASPQPFGGIQVGLFLAPHPRGADPDCRLL